MNNTSGGVDMSEKIVCFWVKKTNYERFLLSRKEEVNFDVEKLFDSILYCVAEAFTGFPPDMAKHAFYVNWDTGLPGDPDLFFDVDAGIYDSEINHTSLHGTFSTGEIAEALEALDSEWALG